MGRSGFDSRTAGRERPNAVQGAFMSQEKFQLLLPSVALLWAHRGFSDICRAELESMQREIRFGRNYVGRRCARVFRLRCFSP